MLDWALPYSERSLDRASARRGDPTWVAEIMAHPESRVIPLWQDRCVVRGDRRTPVVLAARDGREVLDASDNVVFLGLDGEAGVFAADLSSIDAARAVAMCGGDELLDVRRIAGAVTAEHAAVLAYGRGVLYWHRQQRFCGACGAPTERTSGGHVRLCRGAGCGKQLFPRIEPCVIVLVEAPGPPRRCLLGRHRGAAEGVYATLAGFVEIGERLEDAVRREVLEEAGVVVDRVVYQASQPWPFPSGLMVGFRARAASESIAVDTDELLEARWFTEAEIAILAAERGPRRLFNDDSIERFLVESWMREPHLIREMP
jgi:NAD+ diphosphatase